MCVIYTHYINGCPHRHEKVTTKCYIHTCYIGGKRDVAHATEILPASLLKSVSYTCCGALNLCQVVDSPKAEWDSLDTLVQVLASTTQRLVLKYSGPTVSPNSHIRPYIKELHSKEDSFAYNFHMLVFGALSPLYQVVLFPILHVLSKLTLWFCPKDWNYSVAFCVV